MQPSTATMPSAADALTALNAYQPPSSADVLAQAQTQYNVPQLQSQVQALQSLTGNLTSSIAAVDPSVNAQTAGSLVNEGQRQALVARNQAPLQAELGTDNTALSQQTDAANTAAGNAKDAAAATEADNQSKENQLLQTYNIANAREAAATQAQQTAAQQAEAEREFNVGQQNSLAESNASNATAAAAAAPNPAEGYSVKSLSSGNKAYSGPNGETNLYQYASALAGGDPNSTYSNILAQLKTGSPTDKAAYNKVANMPQAQGLAYLQKNNGYIFN